MGVERKAFGDEGVELFSVKAGNIQVDLTNYGATIVAIHAPDRNGHIKNITVNFDNLADIKAKSLYYGATCGRVAGRISNAEFTLNGKAYKLAQNNGTAHLHGGNKGFDKVVWDAKVLPGDDGVEFTYLSPDGDEGYPGNLTTVAVYQLRENGEMMARFTVTCDQECPVNVTNHAYFNLSGDFNSTIHNHTLMLNCDKYLPMNKDLIPDPPAPVDSIMTFETPRLIGDDIAKVPLTGGYDHFYILKENLSDTHPSESNLKRAAHLTEAGSGRSVEVFTDCPGIVCYSGNFMEPPFAHQGAVCLETQGYNNAVNTPSFPSNNLTPNVPRTWTTVYRFSAK